MPYGQVLVDTVKDSLNNVLAPASAVFRNRIINGAMVIDQRNAGASGTASGYTVDRWGFTATQASKFTWQQNAGSVTPPTGFTNYLGFTSSSAYSVLSTDTFLTHQPIEGYNVADLGWGTANAKTVTVSFWVRSSLTGTFGGALVNSAADRSYPFSYSIPTANTWTSISVTVAGDTSGTWLTTNGIGMYVRFGLGSGTTYSGTSGAWATGNYVQPTGTVSVVGTSSATFYITGVQLEVGSNATSFEYRPYGTELALCQRYYWQSNNPVFTTGVYRTTTVCENGRLNLPVTMRAAPTVTSISGTNGVVYVNGTSTPLVSVTLTGRVEIIACDATTAAQTQNIAAYVGFGSGNNLLVSAEL
jgi:hypothetical protein